MTLDVAHTFPISVTESSVSVVFPSFCVIEFKLYVTMGVLLLLPRCWKADVCVGAAQMRLCTVLTLLSCDHALQGEGGTCSRP